MERDPYAKDAKIKEEFKESIIRDDYDSRTLSANANQVDGARLRMDAESSAKIPHSYVVGTDAALGFGVTNEAIPLETTEQERKRLFRTLINNIAENEVRMRVLRDMINGLEVRNKQLYFLRDSISQCDMTMTDQVWQLREIFK